MEIDRNIGCGALILIAAAALIVGILIAWPQYRVYSARLTGEAQKAQAEGSRQILVTQAKAEREAAVERAEAIKIVGAASKAFPEYRQQEFIGAFGEALREGNISQIVYVPTEANLPIIERARKESELQH